MPKTTTEFKLPELGENIDTAEVIRVLISQGDTIEAEQNVAELETEKAVFELPCPHAGKVAEIRIKEGDSIAVGDVVLTVEESGETAEATAEAETAEEEPEEAAAEEETAEEETQESEQGERAEVDEEEAAADQEPEEPEAEPEARREKRKPSRPTAAEEREAIEEEDGRPGERDGKRIPAPAAPATRRLARELGVDLHQLSGSGPGGRITREDVKAFARRSISEEPSGLAVSPETPSLPDFAQWGPVERQPLSKIAKTTAENLARSWRLIPHVTQHELADITDLEARRKEYLQSLGEGAPKITVTALAVKAVVAALKEYPHANSSLDTDSGELIVKRHYHIGVAVDTEHGLLVPVLRDADQKSIKTIAAELTELAEKARNRKLTLEQMRGGTFTISNLGGIGGTVFTPIVYWPQVAILGMARARREPSADHDGQARLMLPLSLSYDHRVINGADGARFVRKVAEILSSSDRFLFEA